MTRPPWTALAVLAAFVAAHLGNTLLTYVALVTAAMCAVCDVAAWITGTDRP